MKRLLRTLVPVLILGMFVAACGDDNTQGDDPEADPLTITVEVVEWSGWAPEDMTFEPAVTVVEVTAGDTFEVQHVFGPATFEVTAVDDGVVGLRSSEELVLRDPDGGFMTSSMSDEFTLSVDEPVYLATPTLDSGSNLTLTLE